MPTRPIQSHAFARTQKSSRSARVYIAERPSYLLHTACPPQPRHQSNEVSIHPDPAPNESRRVGQEGELKQWCVVRSEAGRASLLWQRLTHQLCFARASDAQRDPRGLTKTPLCFEGLLRDLPRELLEGHTCKREGGFGEKRVRLLNARSRP